MNISQRTGNSRTRKIKFKFTGENELTHNDRRIIKDSHKIITLNVKKNVVNP